MARFSRLVCNALDKAKESKKLIWSVRRHQVRSAKQIHKEHALESICSPYTGGCFDVHTSVLILVIEQQQRPTHV
jgi:hypothetical protein